MDEHPNRTNVILNLFGKGQRLPHQPRNPLPQGVVQAFNVACQAALFTRSRMAFAGNDGDVSLPVIGIDFGTLSLDRRDGLP